MTTGRIYRDGVSIATTTGRIYRDAVTISGPKGRIYRDAVSISTLLTADAGPDQLLVEPYSTVTLTAAASSGSPTVYNWAQLSGPTVTLAGAGATRTFIAPPSWDGVALTFGLTVGDGIATSTQDVVAVTVLPHTVWAYRGGQLVPMQLDLHRAA